MKMKMKPKPNPQKARQYFSTVIFFKCGFLDEKGDEKRQEKKMKLKQMFDAEYDESSNKFFNELKDEVDKQSQLNKSEFEKAPDNLRVIFRDFLRKFCHKIQFIVEKYWIVFFPAWFLGKRFIFKGYLFNCVNKCSTHYHFVGYNVYVKILYQERLDWF